jgi:DNA-binding GntR family transcriptional regulator
MPKTTAPSSDSPFGEQTEGRQRAGRANDIRATLQEEIENGTLRPGAALDERALAERFNVSRTPVREALQQLAARDLVRIAPRQGVYVAKLSITQVRATLEYIGELEAVSAKLAARRVDDELRRALESALEQGREAVAHGGAAEYALANTVFHEAIYAGCRNQVLAEQIRAARRLIQRYRVKDFQTRGQIVKSFEDHVKIAQAILAGDETLAAHAMLLHVPAGTTGFSEFLATVPMNFFEAESASES